LKLTWQNHGTKILGSVVVLLGAIGSAIGPLLVRLAAEPRPAPPSGAYIAVSGRVIPGKAIALLAIALLIGPLFAVGRRLINGGSPSRAGWSAALAVAVVGAVPGIVAVLIARANRRDAQAMPPLASTVVDAAGVDLLTRWVNSLSGCN
jgi:hypothetical protein